MGIDLFFVINSLLFGVGLAMDAFSVSLANGLNEPKMSFKKTMLIAGVFGGFQTIMPMLGWVFVHSITFVFEMVQPVIPWVAFALLLLIGGKMIRVGRLGGEKENPAVNLSGLLVQGIATSIDALSVGFTISEYSLLLATTEALIIGLVTFLICIAGLKLGKAAGDKLNGRASVLGGVILIAIGIEIVVKSFLP